jgi:N-hydroxyarylamine O-acetyltransferase
MPDSPDEWRTGELDLDAYLRRTGYDGDLAPTGQTLAGLHRAHVATIPFENADIMLGRGVAVDLPSIQDKLVHRGRGGYCFEHGQLLGAVLERLGYRVSRLLARVGGEHNARTHLVLRVAAGGQNWLADTGFGTGLIEPLPFGDDEPHEQYGWTYRLITDGEHAWRLAEDQDGEWVTRYWFDDQPQYPADVTVANHFTATYPDSAFVRQLVIIRKDTSGLRMLTGRRLSITRPGLQGTDRQLGDEEFASTLTGLFGLRLDAAETTRLTTLTGEPPCSPSPG